MEITRLTFRPWLFNSSACVLGWLFGLIVYSSFSENVHQFLVESYTLQLDSNDHIGTYHFAADATRSSHSLLKQQKGSALYQHGLFPLGGDRLMTLQPIPNYILMKTPCIISTCPVETGVPLIKVNKETRSYFL